MLINVENPEDLKASGVYCLECLINDKMYIGSTKMKFIRRLQEHVRQLKTDKHHNTHLQNTVSKYGLENFQFKILEIVEDISILREREKYFIDTLSSVENGFNHSNNTKTPPSTKEIREKISNTLKEKYKNDLDFQISMKKINENRKGKPSWNLGLKCDNISNARKAMFDDIEVYDLEMNFFRKFDNPLEIERFSQTLENDLPIPKFVYYQIPDGKGGMQNCRKKIEDKVCRYQYIYRAMRQNKFYKGLFFKRVPRNSNIPEQIG